ncbi:MAG: chemotaxis protein CheB [bacterium]
MTRKKATLAKETAQKKAEPPASPQKSAANRKMTATKKKPTAARKKPGTGKKKTKPALKKAVLSKKKVVPSPKTIEEERRFPIVGIGASAGGLQAFEEFLREMPVDSGMAFVVVAHLDPTHVSILPELLQKQTKMPVHQISDGMKIMPDSVYVIPPNRQLTILNGVLQLTEPSQPRGANLPIDSFFRSLAQDQGANAVCIILSGTGTDGTLGLKAIKGEVGMVMVQDEESAKYDGMPRSAMATNLADYVLPPGKMPEQLIKYMKYAVQKTAPRIVPIEGKIPDALQRIYVILRTRTSHDFSLYKKNTICRRIERRMNVHQIENISDYVRYLQESERELSILFKELLIGVTNFFRDPDAFESLKKKALPELLKKKPDDSNIRVWVPGCSSGEEAYSIAIILHETLEESRCHFNVQIFGTDIDEDAIDVARAGVYPASISTDVGQERLNRYFVKEDDGQYRIKKTIREMLVFAPQNVIKDPPFTKLDLICCRNLLIYLGQELQRRLLPLFHYSLVERGVLFLGSSETVGQSTDLFALIDKKWKIFRRNPVSAPHVALGVPAAPTLRAIPEPEVSETIKKAEELSMLQVLELILQQSDTPPCAIIDDTCNVIYIHGRTGRFLEPAEGKVSINLLEMARPGLKTELAAAIRKVSLCTNRRRSLRICGYSTTEATYTWT